MSHTSMRSGLAGLGAGLRHRRDQRRAYRRTRDELAAMSDRELADIGVDRVDIPSLARAAVYGG